VVAIAKATNQKIGIVACSVEELPEGTVPTGRAQGIWNSYALKKTVTICLPLFLEGGEEIEHLPDFTLHHH